MASIVLQSGNGVNFHVSPEDEIYVKTLSWTAYTFRNKQGRKYIYIGRRSRPGRNAPKMYLHRVILERMHQTHLTRHLVCDHVNGDTLDNRRENLRVTTSGVNRFNSGPNADSTSGHRGVHWNSATGKWVARFRFNKTEHFLGYHDTVEQAAEACQKAAKMLIGNHVPMKRRNDA